MTVRNVNISIFAVLHVDPSHHGDSEGAVGSTISSGLDRYTANVQPEVAGKFLLLPSKNTKNSKSSCMAQTHTSVYISNNTTGCHRQGVPSTDLVSAYTIVRQHFDTSRSMSNNCRPSKASKNG